MVEKRNHYFPFSLCFQSNATALGTCGVGVDRCRQKFFVLKAGSAVPNEILLQHPAQKSFF